ncbi:hypothetical protein X975_05638, partial [Stegodyphus mimosarum]
MVQNGAFQCPTGITNLPSRTEDLTFTGTILKLNYLTKNILDTRSISKELSAP